MKKILRLLLALITLPYGVLRVWSIVNHALKVRW